MGFEDVFLYAARYAGSMKLVSKLIKFVIIALAALIATVPLHQLMYHDDLDDIGKVALLQYWGIVLVASGLIFLAEYFLKTVKVDWKNRAKLVLFFLLLPFTFVVMVYGGAGVLVFIFFGYGAYVVGLLIQKKMKKEG